MSDVCHAVRIPQCGYISYIALEAACWFIVQVVLGGSVLLQVDSMHAVAPAVSGAGVKAARHVWRVARA